MDHYIMTGAGLDQWRYSSPWLYLQIFNPMFVSSDIHPHGCIFRYSTPCLYLHIFIPMVISKEQPDILMVETVGDKQGRVLEWVLAPEGWRGCVENANLGQCGATCHLHVPGARSVLWLK
ncbi:hypothetical protein Btru_049813 [Bulinus truncatus]|nr:hypothetical protein Btru_049813 [Bulinus truncatus]